MTLNQDGRPVAVPTISIVCPTFNSASFIGKTLDSVFGQTVSPYELVVSDDGSSDGTADLIERMFQQRSPLLRCLLVRNEHCGPGAARNAGIRAATGDWIAFLDSDDLWQPEKLERVWNAIGQHPDANFVCHHETMIRKDGTSHVLEYGRRFCGRRSLVRQVYASNIFSTSAVVCRRSLLLEYGLFDETLMSAQDYELWLRLSPHVQPLFVEEVLGCYVERAGNITSGSSGARMLNEFRIAVRHARMVPMRDFATRVVRIMATYARQFLIHTVTSARRCFVSARRSSSGEQVPEKR